MKEGIYSDYTDNYYTIDDDNYKHVLGNFVTICEENSVLKMFLDPWNSKFNYFVDVVHHSDISIRSNRSICPGIFEDRMNITLSDSYKNYIFANIDRIINSSESAELELSRFLYKEFTNLVKYHWRKRRQHARGLDYVFEHLPTKKLKSYFLK
jgi:hypothetical protein